MPTFLDSISSSNWLSGLLPPINRLGQSVTPLMMSNRLRNAPLKSRWLPRTTFLMGVPFVVLSALVAWSPDALSGSMPFCFLILYAIFFAVTGTNQAVYNTVQGKLIAAHRRGRLVAIAGYLGSPAAILAVIFVMRPWVDQDPPLFSAIFLFTGCAFMAASFSARMLVEQPDELDPAASQRRPAAESLQCLKDDVHLRRLCLLGSLVAATMVVFPYYQRLGHTLDGYHNRMLMTWVIAQNVGAALFSWIAGRIADARGTRSALRLLTFSSVLSPMVPLLLSLRGSADLFWITFLGLGAVPVTFRMKMNYVLELTDPGKHPVYISTVALTSTPVIFLSPLAGVMVARMGYLPPLLLVSATAFVAWVMTLWIVEPRNRIHQPVND